MMITDAVARHRVDGTLTDAIEFCYGQDWTDGLPVVPPTEALVEEMLEASGREPDDLLGEIPERGRVVTAEKAAVNAVLAGCLPSYAPVVMTAVEAICEPRFKLHGNQGSTGGSAVMLIVNGPVVGELGMNTGINALVSFNRANATIGRALRLIIRNVFGGKPGVFDRATLGWPGKYSFCVAEDEEVVGWVPLHEERGAAPDSSAVTLF
jgi:hypothetical protein